MLPWQPGKAQAASMTHNRLITLHSLSLALSLSRPLLYRGACPTSLEHTWPLPLTLVCPLYCHSMPQIGRAHV